MAIFQILLDISDFCFLLLSLSCPDCLLRSQPVPTADDQQQEGTPSESFEGTVHSIEMSHYLLPKQKKSKCVSETYAIPIKWFGHFKQGLAGFVFKFNSRRWFLVVCRLRWKAWRWFGETTGRTQWRRTLQALATFKVTRRKSNHYFCHQKKILFRKCESLGVNSFLKLWCFLFRKQQRQTPQTQCNLRFPLQLAFNQTSFYGLKY